MTSPNSFHITMKIKIIISFLLFELGNPFPTSLKLNNPNACYEYLSQFHHTMSVRGTTDEISRAHESFTRALEDAGEGILLSAIESCRDSLSLDGFKFAPNEVREVATSNLDSIAIISKTGDRTSSYQQPPPLVMEADVVVAKDGSGQYTTISEAIKAVPPQSVDRFVIYVKKGVYNENVMVQREKWNVVMYGDGMDNTVVSSNRSNQSGSSTSYSATFSVFGKGFIAKNMGFQNSAGGDKGQGVALLSASDQSVFYKCSIEGYQDTLCTHSNRQFYRECKIYGTMDFIYGEAAVVIQKSDILVRRPTNTITTVVTAQGKWNPQSISGIVIQNCNIMAAEDLGNVTTFLGRPWKDYATVVVMQSKMGSSIDPTGWSGWEDKARLPDTVHYVEHDNSGPGADTGNRVRSKGVIVENTEAEASKFTVRSFINGDQWIPSTGVPFEADL